MSEQYRWTEKLPALAAGLVAIVLGLWAISRKCTYCALIGAPLLVGGGVLVYYASTIGSWCVPADQKLGTATWGQTVYKEPSLRECLGMTR